MLIIWVKKDILCWAFTSLLGQAATCFQTSDWGGKITDVGRRQLWAPALTQCPENIILLNLYLSVNAGTCFCIVSLCWLLESKITLSWVCGLQVSCALMRFPPRVGYEWTSSLNTNDNKQQMLNCCRSSIFELYNRTVNKLADLELIHLVDAQYSGLRGVSTSGTNYYL